MVAPVGSIYPYLIPESFLEFTVHEPPGLLRPLGHGLHIDVVRDYDGAVRSCTPEDLAELGLTVDQMHERALENLEELVRSQQVRIAIAPQGPSGKPFAIIVGHWASAACILLPRLRTVLGTQLGTADLLASIPHREALLAFDRGDRAYRDEMRDLVRANESDGRKPLTFELFELTDSLPVPFDEP